MALVVKDRVAETSITTGTGALTLAGAITGFQPFSAVCSTSDTAYYAIVAVDSNGNPSGDWEAGLGTYSGTNTLTRTTVQASTNSNAAVNFGAGTKHVYLSATAAHLALFLQKANNLSDLADAATARTNLDVYSTSEVDAAVAAGGGGGGGILDANWFDVTAYGATGDGSTDDTTAIQDAIDACATAGGGTVYFPRGTYIVGGALQDTSRSNAQILLPRLDYGDTEAITVVLRGEAPPSTVYSVVGATPLQDNLSVIKGTLNTGSGTRPAMIGAQGPVGTLAAFTNLFLVMRDLTIRMPADPVLTAMNLSTVAQIDLDNVIVDAGNYDIGSIAAQTTSTSYGLLVPDSLNGAMTRLGVVTVVGFYNGISVAEHTHGQNINVAGCKQAVNFGASAHASKFERILVQWCQKGLVFTGGEHVTSIQEYDVEHAASGTWVNTYDVDDGSNYARGALKWHVVLSGTGDSATFNVNGAKSFKRERLHRMADTFGLVDAATVTIDCNQGGSYTWTIGGARTFANPTNPYDGQVINVRIKQDATGGRVITWGSKFKFPGGTAAVLSTAASAKDFLSAQYDATDDTWDCSLLKAMG